MFTDNNLIKTDKEYRSKERAKGQIISTFVIVLLVSITIYSCASYGVFTTLLWVFPVLAVSILIMSGISGNLPHTQLKFLIQEIEQDFASTFRIIMKKFR
jgi:hypothetical protein